MEPIHVDFKPKTAEATFNVSYDVCFNEDDDDIRLPSFHAQDDTNVKWMIKFTPEEPCSKCNIRILKLFTWFESPIHQDLMVRHKTTVTQTIPSQSDVQCCEGHGGQLVKKKDFTIDLNIIYHKVSASQPNGYHKKLAFCNNLDNCLIIKAKYRYYSKNGDQFEFKGLPEEGGGAYSTEKCVLDGLAALLASGELADATLVVGGEELPAHRAILAAQSDVFKAMFLTACSEKDSGRVTIEDIDCTTMKELLRFLYTGSVDVDQDCLPALLVAADKYMVAGLRELCQRRLEKALRDDLRPSDPEASSGAVLCGVLRASALLGSEPLRRLALDFLKSHMEAVVRTPAWAELVAEQRELAGAALVDAVTPPPPPAAAAEEQGTAGNKGGQKKKCKRRN